MVMVILHYPALMPTVEALRAAQEKELPFDIGRHPAPALLIAVNGLDRSAQELGQFFLGLLETFSEGGEFGIFHGPGNKRCSIKTLSNYTTP